MSSESADRGGGLPAGGLAGPLPSSDAVAGGAGGFAGPAVEEVLVANGLAAQAAAQPPQVTALQRVLDSTQAIVANNQAIAARITANELAQGPLHPQGLQNLPMAVHLAFVALGTC